MLASQLSTEGVEEGGGECQKNNAHFPQEEAKFKLVIESKEKREGRKSQGVYWNVSIMVRSVFNSFSSIKLHGRKSSWGLGE